jgi:hypothetical protein
MPILVCKTDLKQNQGPKVLESSLARGPLQCQSEHYNTGARKIFVLGSRAKKCYIFLLGIKSGGPLLRLQAQHRAHRVVAHRVEDPHGALVERDARRELGLDLRRCRENLGHHSVDELHRHPSDGPALVDRAARHGTCVLGEKVRSFYPPPASPSKIGGGFLAIFFAFCTPGIRLALASSTHVANRLPIAGFARSKPQKKKSHPVLLSTGSPA